MRIDSSVPGHVARAYGLKLVRPVGEAARAQSAGSVRPTDAAAGPKAATQATSITPTMKIGLTGSAQPSVKIGGLIAGQVPGPVDFSSGLRAAASAGEAMQLYTRSADRIEAATAIQIGRQLDVKA